jgi:4-hydroxy-3-methylbut-2-enyl diphosphate reductase
VTDLLVCAALGIEARALRAAGGLWVVHVGMGIHRAEDFARQLPPCDALVVAGFGGAAFDALRPGDVVVAGEVRRGAEVIACPWADSLAAALERHLVLDPETPPDVLDGADPAAPAVIVGPIATLDHIAPVETLTRLAAEGVTTVDMESFPLVAAARDRPFAVVRVVVDTPEHPLFRPSTLRAGIVARRRLRAIGAILRDWASALDHTAEPA